MPSVTRLALWPLLFATVFASAQNRDYGVIQPAVEVACACLDKASLDSLFAGDRALERCIGTVLLEEFEHFEAYYGIELDRMTLADADTMRALGRDFGQLIAAHCPQVSAFFDAVPGAGGHPATKGTNLGTGDPGDLFLGHGEGWTMDGVEGVDELLAELCACMQDPPPGGESWDQGVDRCFDAIIPRHVGVYMACIDESVLSDPEALMTASHDLGVAIGMRLVSECEELEIRTEPPAEPVRLSPEAVRRKMGR